MSGFVLKRVENGASVEFVLDGGNMKHVLVFHNLGKFTLEELQELFAHSTMSTVTKATKITVENCRWVDAPSKPAIQPNPVQNGPSMYEPRRDGPRMKASAVQQKPPPVCPSDEFEEFDLASVNDPAP